MDRLERQLVEAERAACAELVRAQGCVCDVLWEESAVAFRDHGGRGHGISEPVIDAHDSRCPQALAAAIEARGRA